MKDLSTLLPTGMRFRELWLPAHSNNNASLPFSVNGGRALTLTGAQGRTTADGVKFDSTATSRIDCGAIHNGAAKLWVSLRFKLYQPFTAAAVTAQYIWIKRVDGNNFMAIHLVNGDGRLKFIQSIAGVPNELYTLQNSWNANQWYHVLFSISNVAGRRLLVNNGAAVTGADVGAAPAASNVEVGGLAAAAAGLVGEISDVTMGTDDLTAAEEADLAKGIPPSDAVNRYCLDEGMGVTAYDRGSGGNNGTLGATAAWAFGGCKQPILSLDGINDYAQSAPGVNFKEPCTFVWAGKMKSTYSATSRFVTLWRLWVDANNYISMEGDLTPQTRFVISGNGNGTGAQVIYDTVLPTIDDYRVCAMTLSSGGIITFYRNGVWVSQTAAIGPIAGTGNAYLGATQTPDRYDVSKPLLVGLVDGAMTADQVRTFSRALDQRLGMGIGI